MTGPLHLLAPHCGVLPHQAERMTAACAQLPAPIAVLDHHALSANAHDLVRRAQSKPIRVASKSIRCTAVLKALLAVPGFAGVLAFTLEEAIMLVKAGISDDVVVGYPTVSRAALRQLAGSTDLLAAITLMIDHPDQLSHALQAHTPAAPLRVCLDLDLSLAAGPLHLGTRRSPIHTEAQVQAAAEFVTAHPHVRLVGLMGYEAQIAGVPDDTAAIRLMKRISRAELRTRRASLVATVARVLAQRGLPELEFVNGGGTGSLESTAAEDAVTEVAAGSGIFAPHLFDRYDSFSPQPAAFFGLDVVRAPAPGIITVLGGGWIASGAPGADRLPQPVDPPGLRYTATEGAGEVQTPLRATGKVPRIGDRVWFRHTKAGELAEHVTHFQVLTDRQITASLPTYRGEGHALL